MKEKDFFPRGVFFPQEECDAICLLCGTKSVIAKYGLRCPECENTDLNQMEIQTNKSSGIPKSLETTHHQDWVPEIKEKFFYPISL